MMKLEMDRNSHMVMVTGLEKGSSVTMSFGKDKALVQDANKDGNVSIDCSKMISKHLREEVIITVKQKDQPDMEHIYEIRMTKLIPKRIVEIRKEK